MTAYDPAQWDNFCNAFSNASGALLGLALVAITLNLKDILEDKRLPRRAIETLVFLAYPLAAALLVQVPGLSNRGAGWGQAALALGLIGLAIRDIPRWRRDDPNEPLSWTLTEVAPGAVIAVVATVGAIASLTASIGGLYWLAAAMGIATACALMNSWVLLVEIKR
jgi:energy-converting hydrogenase Eha subunit A